MTNGTGKPKHLKEYVMSRRERDPELCSAGEEDEYLEVDVHSPTDSSEDSVEVKVSPILFRNKRKCAEPRKRPESFTGPLKKRMCLKIKSETSVSVGSDLHEPFRPWNVAENNKITVSPVEDGRFPPSGAIASSIPHLSSLRFILPQESRLCPTSSTSCRPPKPSPSRSSSPVQPIPLIKKSNSKNQNHVDTVAERTKTECDINSRIPVEPLRVPIHPQVSSLSTTEADSLLLSSSEAFPTLHEQFRSGGSSICDGRKEQRNYKNMTRERRIEANARERTRVHTISAAYDTLRKAIPSYSHNQKLSKLSVLRIACSYIMTLSNIVTDNEPGLQDGVDNVSKTIQKEGKLRKKKDDE